MRAREEKDYSEWTKHDYKLILKIFFRWLRKTEDYPEEVRWIKTRIKNNNLLPEEVLTEDEIKKMAECAFNLRDRALILVLYESGCRIGEILSLRVRNVQFDDHGAVLLVSGKTGDRRVRVIASAPKLSSWIENHPLGEDINAPLWVSFSTRNKHQNLSYAATKLMLKKVGKKAGVKKRIYPHLFRYPRATFLANFLTEAQLKLFFGWVQDSRMASTYVHLSGRDVDNALLRLQGISRETSKKETRLKTIKCVRCGKTNSPASKFCMRCGSPLTLETALKFDDMRKKADRLMSILIQDPEILEKTLNKLDEIKKVPEKDYRSFASIITYSIRKDIVQISQSVRTCHFGFSIFFVNSPFNIESICLINCFINSKKIYTTPRTSWTFKSFFHLQPQNIFDNSLEVF